MDLRNPQRPVKALYKQYVYLRPKPIDKALVPRLQARKLMQVLCSPFIS